MPKKDLFIEKIAREVLTSYFEEADESLRAELIEMSIENLPIGTDTPFGKVSIEIPVKNIITHIVDEMNSRMAGLSLKFRDSEMEIVFEESEGLKAGLEYFTKAAIIYLLSNMRPKLVSMIQHFFNESLQIALLLGQVRYAEKIGSKENLIPADIDTRPILNELREQEAADDKQRIARWLSPVENIRVLGKKGRPSFGWTKAELSREVKKALRSLPEAERDVKGVHKRFIQWHPTRTPKSAQALKQLIYEKGLRLKILKDAVTKGRKIRAI